MTLTVCCHPNILLPLHGNVTTSSLHRAECGKGLLGLAYFIFPQMIRATTSSLLLLLGVWVGYGGVKTLENRSRKFNLLIFSRLPRYVYMDDILSRFKLKERGSSSSDSFIAREHFLHMQLVVPNPIGCVLDKIIGSHYILLLFVLKVLCFLTVRCAIIPFIVNLCISFVPVVISRLGNNVTIVRIILILNYYP